MAELRPLHMRVHSALKNCSFAIVLRMKQQSLKKYG